MYQKGNNYIDSTKMVIYNLIESYHFGTRKVVEK